MLQFIFLVDNLHTFDLEKKKSFVRFVDVFNMYIHTILIILHYINEKATLSACELFQTLMT